MLKIGDSIQLSASDLVGHLNCRYLTGLDIRVATGTLEKPKIWDPLLEVLRERGALHEEGYVEHLRNSGYTVTVIHGVGVEQSAVTQTIDLMRGGSEIIVQGAFRAEGWGGRTDILRRVEVPSDLGAWSYEVIDTKLARETKGGTVLQLCLYSDLLASAQGAMPEFAYVVAPWSDYEPQRFRTNDYAAYYRYVKGGLNQALATSLSWTMWRWTDGENAQEKLTIPDAGLEASALYFPFRDAGFPVLTQTSWRGEIDVVALIPGYAVLGIELKVLSTIGGLAAQMDDQVAGLKLLADRYECPFLAQIALAPAFPQNLGPRVNRLSFDQLREAVNELGAAVASPRDILTIVARQLEHVCGLASLPPDPDLSYVTLEELRQMGTDPTHASKWVGAIEGIKMLKLYSRPRWKIAKERLSPNWYPLLDVVNRIEALMAGRHAKLR